MSELMRRREVAAEYDIPEGTLAYWASVGTGPRWAKLGRRVVYRRRDIDAWIDQQFADADRKATA